MSVTRDALAEDLLEQVLSKLSFSTRPDPSFEKLQQLYAAWCRKVPFDNLQKLLYLHDQRTGPFPGDDATDFLQSWLSDNTGGTCWAGHGALYALLTSLGFKTARGIGTMIVAPNIPPNHGTVMVTFDQHSYIVDASILHGSPLLLSKDTITTVDHPAWGVQCHHDGQHWHILWRPLHRPKGMDCRIDQLHVSQQTFHDQHEATRAWSFFNYGLHTRKNRDHEVIGISNNQYVRLDDTGTVHIVDLNADERLRILIEEFGIREELAIRVPADKPTPPPPGSRTARALEDALNSK